MSKSELDNAISAIKKHVIAAMISVLDDSVLNAPQKAAKRCMVIGRQVPKPQTYKAVCKRLGVYKDSNGRGHDWNNAFATVVLNDVVGAWNKTLDETVPERLSSLSKSFATGLKTFSQDVYQSLSMLGSALSLSFKSILDQVPQLSKQAHIEIANTKLLVREYAQIVNRSAKETVKNNMKPYYLSCLTEKGT